MNWLAIAAVNLAAAVMFGAFAAHPLKARLSSEQLGWWHTATEYFFYHALGLLVIGALIRTLPTLWLAPDWHYHFLWFALCDGTRRTALVWCDDTDWWIGVYSRLVTFGVVSV
jgi:hypothetical protein